MCGRYLHTYGPEKLKPLSITLTGHALHMCRLLLHKAKHFDFRPILYFTPLYNIIILIGNEKIIINKQLKKSSVCGLFVHARWRLPFNSCLVFTLLPQLPTAAFKRKKNPFVLVCYMNIYLYSKGT